MGAALSRKRAGKPAPGDPKMKATQLADFAHGPPKGRGDKSIGEKSKKRARSEKVGKGIAGLM